MRNGVIGSTADSDSVSRGSNPFSVAYKKGSGFFIQSLLFCVPAFFEKSSIESHIPKYNRP